MQDYIPVILGFAYTAGAIAFLNPCGIALIPAYASAYIGLGSGERGGLIRSVSKALLFSVLATAGFMAVFGTAGTIMSILGSQLIRYIPWLAVAVGAAIIIVGLLLAAGRAPSIHLGWVPAAHRLAGSRGAVYLPLFGVAYGIASLSCTIPIFLYVALQAAAFGGVAFSALTFTAYSLGMGTSMLIFTTALELASNLVRKLLNRILPYTMRIAGVVMILAGLYTIYWQSQALGLPL